MGENQDEGKVIGNFRAGATSFLSVIFISCLPLLFDKDSKELLEQLRVISPVFAGGVAYALSIPFNMLVYRVDARRYNNQIKALTDEMSDLDTVIDKERIEEIKKDISAYRKKVYDINSKSLFT